MNSINSETKPIVRKYSYRWLRVGLFILIGLITPFALFYLNYFDDKIEQQEIRFFRTLKELENAISQTIDNMPSMHKKTLSRKDAELEKIENKKIKLEENIQSVDDSINSWKKKRSQLIAKKTENEKRLTDLYKKRDDEENEYLFLKLIIEEYQKELASQFFQREKHVDVATKDINEVLKKITACKKNLPRFDTSFAKDIMTPSSLGSPEDIESYKQNFIKIKGQANSILKKIGSQSCQLLSGTFSTHVKKIISQSDSVIQAIDSSNKNIKDNLDKNKLIRNIETTYDDFIDQRKLLDSCKFTKIPTQEIKIPKSLTAFFKSIKNPDGLNDISVLNTYNQDVLDYLTKLNKSKTIISSIKNKCNFIDDGLLDTSIVSYSTYIELLSMLENIDIELNDAFNDVKKLKLEFDSTNKSIKDLLTKDKDASGVQEVLGEFDHELTELQKQKNELVNKLTGLIKQKEEATKVDKILKKALESIKQTSGFENLIITERDVEGSCKKIAADDFISVITPRIDGIHMMLTTFKPKKTSNLNISPPQHKKHIQGQVKVPLDDVINAQTSALPTRFDQVLIADADGKIYYLSSPRHFGEKKQLGRFKYAPFAYDFIGYQNVKELLKTVDNDIKPPEHSKQENNASTEISESNQKQTMSGLSRTRPLRVGDMSFRAFIQPIHLPARYCDPNSEENTKQKQWYLIGVINEGDFQRTALAAPPVIVGSAILLIVIALALLPFLKLVLSDKHTLITKRLRSLVIWSMGICFSFVALLVCLIASYYYLSYGNKLAVKDLNTKLYNQFNAELTTKLNAFELQKHLYPGKAIQVFEHLFSGETIQIAEDLKQCLKDINKENHSKYPVRQDEWRTPFYNFLVLDDKGRNSGFINSVLESGIDNEISLENRAYFRNVRNGNTWRLNLQKPTIEPDASKEQASNHKLPESCNKWSKNKPQSSKDVFIERIISYITGDRETIISSALNNRRVAVMNVRFDTFFRRVLPLHNSFAVIKNNTGRVLYHSTPERDLVENFIDETDGNPALIAKLYHQNEGLLKLNYQAKPIQAYVAPILKDHNDQVLWQLITYKVLDLDENRLLITSLFVACLLLIISLPLFIVLQLFKFAPYINNIYNPKVSLLALFFLIIIISIIGYCVVFSAFGDASTQYEKEHTKKEFAYRNTGFQKIYKRLDWNKIQGSDQHISEDKYVAQMKTLYQTDKAVQKETTANDKTDDFNSVLKSVLPVISYSTGVLVENLNIFNTKEKLFEVYLNIGIFLKSLSLFAWIAWFIIIAVVSFAVVFVVKRVVKELFDAPITCDEPLKDSSILEGATQNEILLSKTPGELFARIKKEKDKISSPAQVVVIDTVDSLLLCHNIYPEESVIIITDLASLLMQNKSNKTLLALLEAFMAQQLQIIMVSNIVPGYWLKVLEQHIAMDPVSDTGIVEDVYRWSVILDKFDVLDTRDRQDKNSQESLTVIDSKYSSFHRQWALCSFEEQSVLTSLADNDLVNRHNSEAIESLFYRGLIEHDPSFKYQKELRIKDKAFIDFIHENFRKSIIDAWRNQGNSQLWPAVLPVILVIIMLAALFLVTTGTEALQYGLSVMAGLVAAIPTLSMLLGYFKSNK